MAASRDNSSFDDFTENVPRAKRDLVMRFVKDQEALQTSQVDLKIVDDEILDLIESAIVAKGEDAKLTRSEEERGVSDKNVPRSLTRQVSNLNLDSEDASKTMLEAVFTPRPPSGRRRFRKRSSSRKVSVDYAEERKLTKNVENESSSASGDEISKESQDHRKFNLSPANSNSDYTDSETNLSHSWPQQCLSRKAFIPMRKYLGYAGQEVSHLCRPPMENCSNVLRPQSSQSFQRVPPDEILTARMSSAGGAQRRITCDTTTLTKPSLYAKQRHRGSRGRTYYNFNRLDAQLSFERPLGLEQVHPADIPLYRSSSAASSAAPCTLVHVPPIGREGPAPSSS